MVQITSKNFVEKKIETISWVVAEIIAQQESFSLNSDPEFHDTVALCTFLIST